MICGESDRRTPEGTSLARASFVGGPEKQILRSAAPLHGLGIEACVATFVQGGEGTALLAAARYLGIDALDLPSRGPFDLSPVGRLVAEIHNRRTALVCAHDAKSALIGLLAARRAGVPMVAWCRGWTGETLRMRIYERMHKRLLKRVDLVVAVSQAQAERCERIGVGRDRLRVVPNAIDPVPPATPEPDIREELAIRSGTRLVLSVGRLSPEKGHRYLVAAAPAVMAAHPEAVFALVGDGQERPRLERQVRRLGLVLPSHLRRFPQGCRRARWRRETCSSFRR